MAQGEPLSIPDFALKIKTKYPEYKDIEDTVLVEKILKKYPDYAESVDVSGLKKKEPSVPAFSQSGTTSSPTQLPSGREKGEQVKIEPAPQPTVKTEFEVNEPENIVDKALYYEELKGRQKEVVNDDLRNNAPITKLIPDKEAIEYAGKGEKKLEAEGLAGLGTELKDFPKEFFDWQVTNPDGTISTPYSKDNLVKLRKENPVRFQDVVNGVKNEYAIAKATGDWGAANEYTNLKNIGDFNQIAPNITKQLDIIYSKLPDTEQKEIASKRLKDSQAYVINPYVQGFREAYDNSEFKADMSPVQYAGLETLKVFNPDKYNQVVGMLKQEITPVYDIEVNVTPDEKVKSTTSDPALAKKLGGKLSQLTVNQQIGRETIMRGLAAQGAENTRKYLIGSQYDLAAENKIATTPEEAMNIADRFIDTETRMQELAQQERGYDALYPYTAKLKADIELKEILQDRGQNVFGFMYDKYARGLGSGVDAAENIVTTLFGDDADKANLALKRGGEKQTFEAQTYLPQSEQRINPNQLLQVSDKLKKEINNFIGKRSLSDLSEKERNQLYDIVLKNQSEIEWVTNPNAGKTKNLFSKATGLEIAGFTADIASFMTQMGILKGVGMGGKLAEATALFAPAYSEAFNEKIAEGASPQEANEYGLLHGGIMALMAKFGSRYEAIQNIVKGGKSPLSKAIAGMSKEAWESLYKKNKSFIQKLGNTTLNVAKEQAKMVGTYGVAAPVITDIADNVFYNKRKSASDIANDAVTSAREMLIGSAGFIAAGLIRGTMKPTANVAEKSILWEMGDNPEISKVKLDEYVKAGELKPEEAEERKKVIDNVSSLINKVPETNDKGKRLTDRQRQDYLYNLVVENKSRELSKSLPDKQADKEEYKATVAKFKNGIELESPTEKQLETRKYQIEKELEPGKDANGKDKEINENVKRNLEAELEAVNSSLEIYKNKYISFEPPREVPQAIEIKKQVEKPVGTEDKDVSLLTKDAEDLLSSIGEGSKPTFITKNLERIAKENGIEVTDKMSADDVINALKEKQQSGKDIPAIDKFNIYDQNSELKSIGTDKEYSDYTSEIFPESKIQDVVYHGTKKEFDKFERKENRNRTRKDKNTEIDTEGFHFVESKAKDSYATIYGEMKPVVLDIKNPITTKYETTEGSIAQKLEYLSKENIDEFKKQGYDSGIIERDSGNEYIVFDPEQIHILGGKSDVENFKTWKNDKIYEITEENIHKKSDEELRERLKYLISRDKKNVGGKEPFGPVIKEKEAKRISKELEERYGIQSVFKDLNKKTLRGTYSHSKMLISINTNTNLGVGNFRRRTIFHEYLHPFVDILENYNKRLFISMAKKARELNKTENFFPKEIKREYEYGTHNQEAIVRLLEKFSDSDVPQSLVKKFFNWLTGFFYSKRKNNKADIKKLSRDTTPEELYNIFKNYGLLKDEAATAPIQLRIKEEIKTLEDFINGKFTEKLTPEQTIDAKEQLRKLKKKLRSLDLYRKSEIDLIREELIKRGIDISKLGIEDTEITSGEIPPPETTDPITIHIDDKRTVLSHRGLQEIATQFGMDDITSRDRKSDLRLLKDAETTINKWVESGDYAKNIESLIKDAENSRVLNDEQRIILEEHIANVRKQAEVIKAEKGINSPEFDEKLRELKRLSDAGAKTRSEAGAALRLPNSSSQPLASLENAMVAKMEANGVDVLTEKQKAEVETQFAEYEKKMADMEAKLEEVTQKKTELEAQLRLQEEVRKSGGRNVKRDYKAERKSLKEQLAEEAKKFLAEGQKMGIASDGGTEQFKISAKMAGIIWDIAKSHVQETGANLAEVTKRVFEDIKALVPGITERDVQDVIAGKYVEKKETRNDLAAQMRQLRIEQQLLDEYDRLLKGGEPKDEKRKVVRNARLAEIRKKIKDLVNPPKEKEGEPKTSEEKKLENIIKANKKKQQEIEQRIKDKDFEDKPKPKSWVDDPEFRKRNPELYKEAIKSIQEREEAKDRFNLALHQDLLSKRSKLKKAFDFASKLISTSKAIKAGIDDSVTFVQLGLTVMANPKKGLEAKIEAFKNTNAARFKRELTALRQSPLWEYIEKGGLDITEPKSEAKEKQEELYSGNLLDRNMKLFGGKNPWTYTGGIFERWFTTMGNSLRSSLYKAKVEEMLAEGKTLENDLEEFQSVARVLNEMTGRGKVNEHLEKAMPVITPIIWAPKMLASSFNILGMGDLVNAPFGKKGFYRSLTPEQRKYAAYQIGRGIGVGVSVMSALAIAGWDVDADPESVGFGSVTTPDGNKSYNVFGRYANTVKVIYQSMSGKRTIKDGFTTDLDEKGGRAGIVGKFFRGKMTPFAGLAYDYWLNSQKNSFTRQPITLGSLPGDLLTPISINEMKKGFEQDGAPSLLTRFLPAFEGLQVQDKRDYPDLSNLSEDSKNVLKEKGLDIPTTKKQKPLTIKNPEEGTKREATAEEMERYTKRKGELMDEKIKGINDAEIGLDKYGDITLNPEKTIETISGSKLTKEQVKKLISLYSTQSAKEARKEVFGNDDDDD